ncbi:membrane fusion protein, multidrug efflux system [Pseudomonas pohangensis]|uniref:Membrane fusion protein, multidrug efflux system n=1 Tax=Pseudomonas pohangensis TaxID=364197 RepID=A0A1H2GPU4_9PSED|nr:efflux RND transporter periplasmic adaptor subunit [Pseudomonas pohangensis]SDU21531.1 membrane fusion protein, multidrug efflux system [Pseudomonas pohangensis]
MFSLLSKRPWLIAILLSVLLVLWLLGGDVLESRTDVDAAQPVAEKSLSQVTVSWQQASPVPSKQVLQGQLEAWRTVELRAQVSGTVERLDQHKGAAVAAGQVLLSLSPESRPAQLAREQAEVRQREAAVTAARRLRTDKLISANDLLKVETELANARVRLSAAQLAMANTQIRAPFAGVLDGRQVELGDYVQPGQPLLTLVDIARLKVSAQVPQQEVAKLQLGQPVRVELLDGAQLQGKVHFIAAAAEPGSRSFRVEVSVDNPQQLRLAGASATLRIDTGAVMGHALSPALISLDKAGRMGVKWVNAQQQVVFTPVQLLSVSSEQAWVSGLPDKVALITLGQGFVEPGEKVLAVEAGEAR